MKRHARSCILLLGLLGYANGPLLSAEATAALSIGFQRESDLFECLPGDKVRLGEVEGRKAMRWEVNYVSKQYRVCVKALEPGILSGMTIMSFRLRAESRHQRRSVEAASAITANRAGMQQVVG